MSRRPLALLALAVALSGAPPSAAQEAAPPLTPQSVEVSAPEEPIRVRAEDAARLIEQNRAQAAAEPATPAPASTSRTIALEPPAVVNGSRQFIFTDVTDRNETPRTPLPLAERRANVEAYRQSLARPRGRGR